MIHRSGHPRKAGIAACGQVIDGVEHKQTMMIGEVDCPACQTIFRANPKLGGYSQRPRRP